MEMLDEAYADSGGVAAMLNKVSTLLERAEQNFQQLVGDPYSAASQRSHFTIGKLAGIIQRVHTTEATEVLVEKYIEHPEVRRCRGHLQLASWMFSHQCLPAANASMRD